MKKILTTKLTSMVLIGFMFLTACNTTGSIGPDGTSQNVVGAGFEAGSKIIRLNNTSEPGYLHPSLSSGTHDSWPLDHMFSGLYSLSEDGNPVKADIEDAIMSEDGLTWTFKLREDARWSNGDPVTAHDYLASWFYTLDPNNAAQYSTQFYIFEGAEEYNANSDPDLAEELKDNVGLKALDDYTIEMQLLNPILYLEYYLTHTTFYPIHAGNQEENPDWYLSPENYITNGAFYLDEWNHKESLKLRKNEYFFDKDRVSLDGIDFVIIEDKVTEQQMYDDNELDLIHALLPAIIEERMNDPELILSDDLSMYYYQINNEKAPFNNAKVRKALAMALDRNIITENVSKGGQRPAYTLTAYGIKTPTGEDFVDLVGETFTEDLEEARRLLEEGLAEENMSLSDFNFSIMYNTNDIHKRIAETVQNMWSEGLGVNVSLESTEFQVLLDRRSIGDYDIARSGWIADYIDPTTFLGLATSNNNFNDFKYFNEEYDDLIEQSYKESDPMKRMEILADAERILMADLPIIPIYHYSSQILKKPNVTGVIRPVNKYPLVYFADLEDL